MPGIPPGTKQNRKFTQGFVWMETHGPTFVIQICLAADFWHLCGLGECYPTTKTTEDLCVCGGGELRYLPRLALLLVPGNGFLEQNTIQNLFFGTFSNIESSKQCVWHCVTLTQCYKELLIMVPKRPT